MKEKIKRLFASIAAILMAIGMVGANAVPVFADGDNNGKITITNTVVGEKYDVYKIFDATTGSATSFDATGANADSRNAAYTYTKEGTTDSFLTALQEDDSPFTLTQQGSSDTYNVELKTGKEASDIISFLNGQLSNISSKKVGNTHAASASTTGSQTGGNITIDNLTYGYYYITTTTGSAVTINSAVNEVTVEDKNSVPSIDKQQSTDAGETKTYTDETKSASIGDTVYYQIKITAGKDNNNTYTVTDTLSDGLTLNYTTANDTKTLSDFSIKKYAGSTDTTGTDVPTHVDAAEGTAATYGYNLTQSDISDRGFKITVDAEYVKNLNQGDTILIKYSAKINENAVIAGNGNTNTAKLEYSQQSTEDTTTVKTYQFDLVKTKDKEQSATTYDVLPGAKFKLYKGTAVTGDGNEDKATATGNALHFKKATVTPAEADTNKAYTTTYTVTTDSVGGDVVDTIEAGNVRIIGLGTGTYALEETEAPSGYNKLTYVKKVTVESQNNDATVAAATAEGGAAQYTSGGVQVINKAGSVLPSTGGIGTTIFYIAGGILIIGAAVLLIARRKRNA